MAPQRLSTYLTQGLFTLVAGVAAGLLNDPRSVQRRWVLLHREPDCDR